MPPIISPIDLPPRLTPAQWSPGWSDARKSDPTPASATLPRITVVTPSYNQAAFLETTIRSVLEQGYPALDYHVIDGGSTDGSVEILRHYEPWLTSWVSEPDGGQVDAILKALARAQGEWFNWINSDDLLAPGALWELARAGDADLYAGCTQEFRDESLEKRFVSRHITERDLVRMPLDDHACWHQPGTWWRTDALRSVGIDRSLHYRFDLELLIRYLRRFPRVQYSSSTLAWFRLHAGSKTVSQAAQFAVEQRLILQRVLDDPDARNVWSDARETLTDLEWRRQVRVLEQDDRRSRMGRLFDILRAANRTPSAWLSNATYDSLGRVLRGPRDAQQALAKLEWRKTVRALRDDQTLSRMARAHAIFSAANRTPGAWRVNTTYSTLGRLLTGKVRE